MAKHLEKLIRGSLTSAFTHYFLDWDLDIAYKEAAAARAARKKKVTGQIAQKGDVIIVREVRGRIAKQAEDEVEKARNALRRAEIAAEKKEKAEVNARKKRQKKLYSKKSRHI